jgi:nucleoside-diphosphate-sugar epimerase
MNQKILLTGATGFVGMQVLRALQKNKVSISLVVRPGWKEKIKNYQNIVNIYETNDLFSESTDWWTTKCKNIDIIIHVAWFAVSGEYLQSEKNIECLTGTLNLVQGASNAGIKKFIGVGTCFEYDFASDILSIDDPLKPESLYAATKVATYYTLSQFLSQKKIAFVWCRLFYLYGENENEDRLVPYIRAKLLKNQIVKLTSGTQIRDYMDVSDAGNVIAEMAFNETQGCVNVCTGTPITVRELAEKIADEYGKRKLLKFGQRDENSTDPKCVVGKP